MLLKHIKMHDFSLFSCFKPFLGVLSTSLAAGKVRGEWSLSLLVQTGCKANNLKLYLVYEELLSHGESTSKVQHK